MGWDSTTSFLTGYEGIFSLNTSKDEENVRVKLASSLTQAWQCLTLLVAVLDHQAERADQRDLGVAGGGELPIRAAVCAVTRSYRGG